MVQPAFERPDAIVLSLTVHPWQRGLRADQWLATAIPRLGRGRAKQICDNGDLRVGEQRLKAGARVRPGEVHLWRLPPDSPADVAQWPSVLLDAGALLVLNKPAGLAVHPSASYVERTVTAWLSRCAPQAEPCHRLDVETSGVLLCARDRQLEAQIKAAFVAGEISKRYRAVVEGRVEIGGVIERPLALAGGRGLVGIRMIPTPGAPAAVTRWRRLRQLSAERAEVELTPLTGRQHQLRAHMALLGHPIVGDKLYGMGDAWFDAYTRGEEQSQQPAWPRHLLHARHLDLPATLGGHRFEAPTPADWPSDR